MAWSRRRVLLVGLLLGAAVVLAWPVRAACERPVSAFAVLAALRDGRAPQAAASGPRGDGPPAGPARRGVLDAVLLVKESDYLAYPLHAAVGRAFEGAGCAPDAVRDQWLKAARHAFAPFAAEIAADGLRRTAPPGADLPRLVQQDAAEMPWFADNLARVDRALAQR